MTRTMVVEGELTAEDTTVTLTTQGSRTSADRQVPPGAKKIDRITVGFAASFDAADGCVFYLRLSGRGIKGGEQIIPVGGAGGQAVQSGGDPTQNGEVFVLEDADIPVVPGSAITFEGEMVAGDVGDATMVVELEFA